MASRAAKRASGAPEVSVADLLALARDPKHYEKLCKDISARRADAHELLGKAQAAAAGLDEREAAVAAREEKVVAREVALSERERAFEAKRDEFRQLVAAAKEAA